MDEKRVKRQYAIRGCYEQKSNYGQKYETNEQRHEMPEVGDKVIVLENTQLERTKDGVVAKYRISNSYLDAHGRPEVFEVTGFSKGRDNALSKDNTIRLYRPFEKSEGYGHRTEVSSVLVAVGNVYLLKVNEKINEVLDELAINGGIASGYGVYGNGTYKKRAADGISNEDG